MPLSYVAIPLSNVANSCLPSKASINCLEVPPCSEVDTHQSTYSVAVLYLYRLSAEKYHADVCVTHTVLEPVAPYSNDGLK